MSGSCESDGPVWQSGAASQERRTDARITTLNLLLLLKTVTDDTQVEEEESLSRLSGAVALRLTPSLGSEMKTFRVK